MKKKVIELINTLSDGGAETLVKDYAFMIDKDKFDIYVVIKRRTPETANYKLVINSGFKVIPIYNKWNIFSRAIDKLFGKRYMKHRLKRIINKVKPDVIHAHLTMIKTLADVSEYL